MKELENYIHKECWYTSTTWVMESESCIDLVVKIALGFEDWLNQYQDKSSAIRILNLNDEEELVNYYVKTKLL
jgi:hypothetical protein